MRPNHIPLDRTFFDYAPDTDPEVAAMRSYLGQGAGQRHWADLVAHGRVIVLGEAGSGKTWEMEAQVDALRQVGRTAFFVRVDELTRGTLAPALVPTEQNRFRRWRDGEGEAVFLLDAKDEAQLADHHAFERALKSFANDLGERHLRRARVIISCRVSEWQRVSDLETVTRLLGPPPPLGDGAETANDQPPVLVVQIAALDTAQVRSFVSARGQDPDPFLRAVEQAYA